MEKINKYPQLAKIIDTILERMYLNEWSRSQINEVIEEQRKELNIFDKSGSLSSNIMWILERYELIEEIEREVAGGRISLNFYQLTLKGIYIRDYGGFSQYLKEEEESKENERKLIEASLRSAEASVKTLEVSEQANKLSEDSMKTSKWVGIITLIVLAVQVGIEVYKVLSGK